MPPAPTQTRSRTHPILQPINSPHTLVELIDKFLMYNLKMAKTCSCALVFSRHSIKNIVVFDDIHIYNLACFLLF